MTTEDLAAGNSNVRGMKRSARDHVASKQVKKAWRTARNYKVKKDKDGNVISRTMNPGLSLLSWARQQVTDASREADVCKEWLAHKNAPQPKSNKPKIIRIKKNKN